MLPMPGPGAYAAITTMFAGDPRLTHFRPDWEADALIEMANTLFGPDPKLVFLNASYEIRAGRLAFDPVDGPLFDDREELKLIIVGAAIFGRFTESSSIHAQFDGGDPAMADLFDRLADALPDPKLPDMFARAIPIGDLRTQAALLVVAHDDGRMAARFYRRPDIDRDLMLKAYRTARRGAVRAY